MTHVPPPRAIFVDHPVGRTFGRPQERGRQEKILGAALAELPNFTASGQIRDLHCQWDVGGSRLWEEEMRSLLLNDR
jgi:hypothetical protein